MKNNILLISMALIMCAGNCPPRGERIPPPQLSGFCAETVPIFNQGASYSIGADLREIQKKYNGIPSELASLYPVARDSWNAALGRIEYNYSETWSGVSLSSFEGPLDSWQQSNVDDVQKFFLLLTELRWGAYDPRSRDVIGNVGWSESASLDKRLNGRIKLLQQRCASSNDNDVRRSLKLVRLPENINDCLNLTMN